MPHRRILSLWFPRLGAERLLRLERPVEDAPFAVVADRGQMQVLSSLNRAASAAGLRRDQPLADAQAMCPGLITRWQNARAEEAFLLVLRRWAGKFSPWVSTQPPASLIVDLTGCAHLFGGEAELLDQVRQDCDDLQLTVLSGIADTVGAAWALARYAGRAATSDRTGDAIDQEAYATRSRAAKRRNWERGGPAPAQFQTPPDAARIAAPGKTYQAIAPLPVAALRLPADQVAELGRLGLRRIKDLADQPRAGLARRFGRPLVQRLDQAIGAEPEPVSPAAPEISFAMRLTLPEPIGLESDVLAAIDRLLIPLSDKLRSNGRGARRVRLECHRTDGTMGFAEVGLARPSSDPDRIRPLVAMKVGDIDAGFGIDMVRLVANQTEPVSQGHRGHMAAADAARARQADPAPLDDLVGRLGARVGLEALTRHHPADTHIPEKSARVMAAAWSEPATHWPAAPTPRPVFLWPSEPVNAPATPVLAASFRWRGRDLRVATREGPERIAPEWWFDDPEWRSGLRDYWRVGCASGDCLWMYYAHGADISPGWYCQGSFG
ncbi:DNA polymerase Y family protein [Maribius pontilimi]|uniref:DNA polymerase Y family protein n=1 Tax=Palleronia pontilimi TaxID=1964209 RepID=A0A934IH30_9RHOB|nr:DNA polymerase Y family protein [Palleronia pontilimi]MBJ3763270.1 DNA polymerase Y family protein [Palleronia pontilimi]